VARLNAGRFKLLDAQFMNPHLARLGAVPITKSAYLKRLAVVTKLNADFNCGFDDGDPELVLSWAMSRQSESAT
jgi:leucyl/phenylalanyl-tRNA---protein transferase